VAHWGGDKLSGIALAENDNKPTIRVSLDTDARTITVADHGIGMSRDEVVTSIGTIAKSGTREFLQSPNGLSSPLGGRAGRPAPESVGIRRRRRLPTRDRRVRYAGSDDRARAP
jgi:hypothetical protein